MQTFQSTLNSLFELLNFTSFAAIVVVIVVVVVVVVNLVFFSTPQHLTFIRQAKLTNLQENAKWKTLRLIIQRLMVEWRPDFMK